MATLPETLERLFDSPSCRIISETNMEIVGEKLRDVLAEHGLGVAVTVAHLHGLKIGHIPVVEGEKQIDIVPGPGAPGSADRFVFVRIPIRKIRGNKAELRRLKIMNPKADPVEFIYHEDGLIGAFSFDLNAMNGDGRGPFSVTDILAILRHLELQGVLIRADVNNRQIQFKDPRAKRLIERSRRPVYVKIDNDTLAEDTIVLPERYEPLRRLIWDTIQYKSSCNYCSVAVLNPREATIHSTPVHALSEPQGQVRATVRNYRVGFTYAPLGDPRTACHFLAWDFPHINDLVMNMDPQSYSFSDLIKLVTVINRDLREFRTRYDVSGESIPVSGVCNHWAGNTIYHQHYQFFKLPSIPVLDARPRRILASLDSVAVTRLDWPMPVYEIAPCPGAAYDDANLMFVADKVAKHWEELNADRLHHEHAEYDYRYGNGIRIKNHTQNIFVTQEGGRTRALFVPRLRLDGKLKATAYLDAPKPGGTTDHSATERRVMVKNNLAVLEALGYFVIDDPADLEPIKAVTPEQRNQLGEDWLKAVAPFDSCIDAFETLLAERLAPEVVQYEQKLDAALKLPTRRERIDETVSIFNEVVHLPIRSGYPTVAQRRLLLEEANQLLFKLSPREVYAAERVASWAEQGLTH
ncbi:MAG: hypothetical protein ACM30E_04695 [Nitrososphaerales archaeon]